MCFVPSVFAFAETVLSGQAVQMHNPQIAQLHKLCMLILALAQALGVKGPKVSTVWEKKLHKHAYHACSACRFLHLRMRGNSCCKQSVNKGIND